ncbi:MAG: hypothetical protein R3F62_07390 [Planctomycetota bacterium]
MRGWALLLCLASLAGCQQPEPRKRVDPDLWDPRHEAALNQEGGPPERKEPSFTRASQSEGAGVALLDLSQENTAGKEQLERAEAEQDARVARQEAAADAAAAREARWLERARAEDRTEAWREEAALGQALLWARPTRIVLERALAHGLGQGDLRRELQEAEARADALRERADQARARAERARADAALAERLHAAGRAGAQSSLRARRRARAEARDALLQEEAALCAAEALTLVRRAFQGN